MQQSLFDKYGGFAVVSRIVLALYDRLLDDDDVGPFFDDVDMPALVDHQTKFVSSLMGGPASFTDKHIAMAHRHMEVNDHQFDQLERLLTETLAEFDLAPEDIALIVGEFEKRRPLIVRTAHVD